jgi:serralysin
MSDSAGAAYAPLGLLFASPAPTISAASLADGLLDTGSYLGTGQFTYSIPAAGAAWPGYASDKEQATFAPLTANQAAAFVDAVAAWDRLIAPNFTRTIDSNNPGYVRVGFSTYEGLDDDTWGYTFGAPPGGRSNDALYGDIWIRGANSGFSFDAGNVNYQSLLHEVGHVLGLKHPFEAPLLPTAYDSGRYTVMSYRDDAAIVVSFTETTTSLQGVYTPVLARSPMVLDIAAVQSVYGADATTALGATVYSYQPGTPVRETIYDAGGVDTIDASAFTRGSDIDLTSGSYSSLGYASVESQIAEDVARHGWAANYIREVYANAAGQNDWSVYTGRDNLGIAFSTVIENAVGGAGDDIITGNSVANSLAGGGGRDFIRGLDGDDLIDGGPGDDDVNGNLGVDAVRGGDGADSVRGGQGNDTVYGDAGDDPHVNGNIGADVVYGGAGRDTLFGGQGSDTLYGEDGADWLSGDLGDDMLVGGAGADRFLLRPGSGLDVAMDFNSATGDRVQLPRGTTFTLVYEGNDAAVILDGGDGGSLRLLGATRNGLGVDWLIFV